MSNCLDYHVLLNNGLKLKVEFGLDDEGGWFEPYDEEMPEKDIIEALNFLKKRIDVFGLLPTGSWVEKPIMTRIHEYTFYEDFILISLTE